MKIALVIQHADPARGGAETYTVDLAQALTQRGHHITLLAATFAAVPHGIHTVRLHATATTRLGKYLHFLDSLQTHLHTTPYDIVHAMLPVRACDIYHPHAGLAAESLASGHLKYRGPVTRKLAQWVNRLNRKRHRFAAIEHQLITGPNPPAVICLSQYVKQSVRNHFSLDEKHLPTLFNAVDLTKFDPTLRPSAREDIRRYWNINPEQVVGLMIAQDFERKGLREAIEALAQVPDQQLLLLVVGKQNPRPYRRLARTLGIRGRVIFAGSTHDAHAYYQAADFFVLPTRHDPCSLVVLESLAMGVPVISTRFNGACEIMTDSQHGFVLDDPASIPALADCMHQMLNDSTRSRMRQACLDLRPTLAQQHHIDQLLEIYQTVPSPHPPGNSPA